MKINIQHNNSNQVKFLYEVQGKIFFHTIEFPSYISPTDDSLFRLALFSRPKNSKRYFIKGVVINEKVHNCFQQLLNANIAVPICHENEEYIESIKKVPINSYLCFSGGFDSIATKAMLPDNIKLISIKFGGAFERESDFFKKFNDNILSWELRGKREGQSMHFNESIDWRFLLAPALLNRNHGESLGILSGTVMEASVSWFNSEKKDIFNSYDETYGPNVALIKPITCLTEYSTALIADDYLGRENIKLSLNSLAAKNSIKYYRKKILLSLIANKKIPKPSKRMKKHKFGTSFADDFFSIYFAWKCGKEWALKNYVDRLPRNVMNIDMSFVEKANQNNLDVLDEELKSIVISKLDCYGIKFYSESDFKQLDKVKSVLLAKKHLYLKNTKKFSRFFFWKNKFSRR